MILFKLISFFHSLLTHIFIVYIYLCVENIVWYFYAVLFWVLLTICHVSCNVINCDVLLCNCSWAVVRILSYILLKGYVGKLFLCMLYFLCFYCKAVLKGNLHVFYWCTMWASVYDVFMELLCNFFLYNFEDPECMGFINCQALFRWDAIYND